MENSIYLQIFLFGIFFNFLVFAMSFFIMLAKTDIQRARVARIIERNKDTWIAVSSRWGYLIPFSMGIFIIVRLANIHYRLDRNEGW